MLHGTAVDQLFMMHHIWDTHGNGKKTSHLITVDLVEVQTNLSFCCWQIRRSYISFDILRRVLANYFGYNVLYVMNITDIDDKIIKRARQNYLYERYANSSVSLEQILSDHKEVLDQLNDVIAKNTDPDKKTLLARMLNQ